MALQLYSLAAAGVILLSCAFCTGQRELVLALEDTFEDFNLSLWKHELTLGGGGNSEFQWYTNNRSNSYVEDGVLHIKPTLLSDYLLDGDNGVVNGQLNIWGNQPADLCTGNAFFGCERNAQASGSYLNPIVSARLRTAESFSFTYGKVEVCAKLPRGDWLWPAIWMLPTDNQYGQWPASGEIDLMESRGNAPNYTAGGYDSFGSTLHWGVHYTQNQFHRTHQVTSESQEQDFTNDFHTYGLIWNETYIGTYLDTESNPVLQVPITQSFFQLGGWPSPPWANPWRGRRNNAPFDRRYFLLLNLAVGGTGGFFPDGDGKPWMNSQSNAVNSFYDARDEWFPTWTQSFQIDSVRVWTYQDVSPVTTTSTTTSSAIGTLVYLLTNSTLLHTIVCIVLSVGLFRVLY
uniref:(1,3)-beta-d-glucan binding protein n=1 Tax=Suberites domuncula TaxID=55567 RepID=Q5W4Y9_SUBDO|nr:(1,3)-beta-d-glucan binding protein [Suberites domuncula]